MLEDVNIEYLGGFVLVQFSIMLANFTVLYNYPRVQRTHTQFCTNVIGSIAHEEKSQARWHVLSTYKILYWFTRYLVQRVGSRMMPYVL